MFLTEQSSINQLINNIAMYKTNQQAWNEVMSGIRESERTTKICVEMFGQENLIGLTNEQRDLFWKSI